MRDQIIATIHELMQQDKSAFFLTGDLGFSVLEKIKADEWAGRWAKKITKTFKKKK